MKEKTPAKFTPVATPEILTAIKQRAQLQTWMKDAAAKEGDLRKKIISHFFPTLKENTNSFAEPGIKVKVTHPVSRKLLVEKLATVMPQLQDENRLLGALISYTPEFSLEWYRALPDMERKIFDQCLEIKDGSDQLEVTLEEAPAKK